MITKLHIKNIGIIEDIEIDFNNGLNVLTGETGAGKSLIIGALNIIAGERFSKEMIRNGEEYSYIEVCLYEPENSDSIDGNIIISREIHTNGRNMCKINGRMTTVNELRSFMSHFIEIHGQNDNQNLSNVKEQRKYLDEYIGKEIEEIKKDYYDKYVEYNEIKKELKQNLGDEKERQRKIDLLNYQIKEISEANLRDGEEEILEDKRRKMLNVEKLEKNLEEADISINGNTIDALSNSIRALERVEQIDAKYEETVKSLKSVYYELQEISRDISGYREEIYFDDEERNEIEERLDLINSLKRKYGNSIKEILEYKNEIEEEVYKIENSEERNNKLKEQLKSVEEYMEEKASKMHNIRNVQSKILSKEINENLKDLELKNAKVNIHIDYQDVFSEYGKDKVVIYISTNLGEEEKELNKIASGGEQSRIMLAIKTVLANTDDMPILIFDEIDTGISGKAANAVADKLRKISKQHQVICISHLPSIAAYADYNYFISKQVINERTNTNIKLLNENEVIQEIARISSGEINDATMKYAFELRNKRVS